MFVCRYIGYLYIGKKSYRCNSSVEQIASQGYIQTITQPCLQDCVKQIAGQGYIQTITQPCLQDHIKQIAGQGYIQTITQPCLQDCVEQIAGWGYIHVKHHRDTQHIIDI